MKHYQNSLLVVSSYPPKYATHHPDIVGVASYTKNTLTSLSKETQITVLAEKTSDTDELYYTEDNLTVKRIWKRNSLMLLPTLLKEIFFYHRDIRDVLVPVEVAMLGGKLQLALLPLFLLCLRGMGKQVTIVLHQVIDNIEDLSGHVYTYEGITAKILNAGLVLYYKVMCLIASHVIVMDAVLKKRLAKFGPTTHISIIPHGVESFTHIPTQKAARTHLKVSQKDFVILYFGFLAHYKGADLLTDAFAAIPKHQRKDITLIMAGGSNPNHTDKPAYMAYLAKMKSVCQKHGIQITGFVPEEKIPYYFSAADLVVFPYRTLMSASGPLSMAYSFGKPFLLSKQLERILDTKDMNAVLKKAGVRKETFVVDTVKELGAHLLTLKKSKTALKKLAKVSQSMQQVRSWKRLGKIYDTVLSRIPLPVSKQATSLDKMTISHYTTGRTLAR